MRILIAPDKFAGTLSAIEAAEAVAAGWRDSRPDDETVLLPLSDGGPGFVEVLHSALGGEVATERVTGPLGAPVDADWLLAGGTAYIESAQACGLHLVPDDRRDPRRTTSRGVGELIARAVAAGAGTVVVGLGGSSTNDGGAGMLAALGARPGEALERGGAALADLDDLDLEPARRAVDGVRIVSATDVDNPLLGAQGASAVFGPQKGADPATVRALDAALSAFADRADPDGRLRRAPGAGAAGGVGFGLVLLGGAVQSGVALVLDAVGLDALADGADAVVTGEGSFDAQSLRGKLPQGVALAAAERGLPCLVAAGVASIDPDEAAAAGVTAVYTLVESAGREAAMARSGEELRRLAATIALGAPGSLVRAASGA